MSVANVKAEETGPLYAAAKKVYPQSVSGTFRRLKWRILWFCLAIYYFLPFVRWDRGPNLPHQAVLVDFEHSRFYFFFIELWPQEVYYFTGLLILAALGLFLTNALFGRVWCGYFCPQTVWTDLFLWVERLIEGDRRDRIKLDAARWDADKIAKRIAKHGAWLIIAWWTGGAWVLYFADAPTLVGDLATLRAPLMVYIWVGIFTFTTYYLAGHMREQFCLYMCPWPRIQAALTDTDALNVSYRWDRGEPRMSLKEADKARAAFVPAGDCVDCNQCVAVCPTGVDIRQGLQPGCIQCGLCIDACDAVMAKIRRPTRLIGYDTDENIKRRQRGEPAVYRLVRSRTIVYVVVMAIVGALMLYQLAIRQHVGLSVMHVRAPMYTATSDGGVRNGYLLRFSNKWSETRKFAIEVSGIKDAVAKSEQTDVMADGRLMVEVDPDATQEIELFVTAPRSSVAGESTSVTFKTIDLQSNEVVSASDHFFSP
ncbi:MAG: cytochrome c oxidase accessory protein CcoG [Roseiarcus sp.]